MEVRHVDPDTGGAKCNKPSQISTLDPLAMLALGEVAGYGLDKYARYNYLRGFDYSLAYDAMQRHASLAWSGEDIDPESGLSHWGHAAWHCLALLSFQIRGIGNDNRPHYDVINNTEPLSE